MSGSNDFDFLPQMLREHQALQILRIMVNPALNRAATDRILYECLELTGLFSPRPALRSLLDRMEQNGLIFTKKVDDCIVARLTEKGERVALGKDRVDGVAAFYPE